MRKNYGQINDHRGNSIAATRDMRMLYDAGWRIVQIRRRGMYKQVWWYRLNDPNGDVWSQGAAVDIQRTFNRLKKGESK